MTAQYTIDISANGTGTFTNVVPGTYRLSVFNFGQWGEYRNDTVVVTAGNTTTVTPFTFQAENFGTVVGTIGTPDRSSHEFLHGAYTQNYADGPLGYDDRETYSAWNYWADWANSPVPGAPVYNLTDGPGYTATNNPLKWNYAHWGAFDPGIYGGACPGGADNTNGYQLVGCTSLGDTIGIPAYVATLTGHSGTNGVTTPTPPWQIHFTTPNNPSAGFVVLSHALASSQTSQTVTLNTQTALTYSGGSSHFSDAVERSGLSGYTEWVTYQWPVSALNPAGTDNVITIKVTGTNSNNSDDAFRLEFSTAGASPTVTGFHDYSFVTKVGSASNTTAANDTVPNP
jgi:rhamnogalacturonan endolyase